MENLFEALTDYDLSVLLSQYDEWKKTGYILSNTELGKMQEKYINEYPNVWQINLALDLLSAAATNKRWKELNTEAEEENVANKGCNCCNGDEALFWKDNENNAFVDRNGEMLVTVKDHTMRFKVKCCPNCGRKYK